MQRREVSRDLELEPVFCGGGVAATFYTVPRSRAVEAVPGSAKLSATPDLLLRSATILVVVILVPAASFYP